MSAAPCSRGSPRGSQDDALQPRFGLEQVGGQPQSDRQSPILAGGRRLAGDSDASILAETGQVEGQIHRRLQSRARVPGLQLPAQRPIRGQVRDAQMDPFQRPAIPLDPAAIDADAIGQGGNAGFARRARGQPVLERGQIENRRIQFQPDRGQIAAACAQGRPWHGDEDAFGAQQGFGGARFARHHAAHDQLRRSTQTVFADARSGDFQAQRVTGHAQQRRRQPLWLQQPMHESGACQQQDREG